MGHKSSDFIHLVVWIVEDVVTLPIDVVVAAQFVVNHFTNALIVIGTVVGSNVPRVIGSALTVS